MKDAEQPLDRDDVVSPGAADLPGDTGQASAGQSPDSVALSEGQRSPLTADEELARQRQADLDLSAQPLRIRRRRRLPALLFLLTCFSLFWAGASHWTLFPQASIRQTLVAHWRDGLVYTVALLAILATHEMGHFLTTVRYRIAASFPYFLPFPISPIGTLGAVIAMDGRSADRKQIFDIGLAGPLAGLAVAIPITWLGIAQLDFTEPAYGAYALDVPLLVRLAFYFQPPAGYEAGSVVWFSQLNPLFMAGWVGLLITGLNMLPVSQLDGGHVSYSLFGRAAHWVARGFLLVTIGYIVIFQQWHWIVMVLLVLFIGPDHPPTRDDDVVLGRGRFVIGCLSLAIPLLCFSPRLLLIAP